MILEIGGKPNIDKSVFIAPNTTIIGNVTIAPNAGIWFNTVIRADINSITIGEYTNIQDLTVIHVPTSYPVSVGSFTTVGHKALIHGCSIGNNCLIGMGAIIMDRAIIGNNCIIGAGSLITEGTEIPDNSLVLGSPGKIKRSVTEDEVKKIKTAALEYFEYSRKYI